MHGATFPWISVSKSALRSNVAALRSRFQGVQIMAMVKANAYGHGVAAISCLAEAGVDAFGVARVEEGVAIRALGISLPVLVLGSLIVDEFPALLEHRLEATLASESVATALNAAAQARGQRVGVHIKIDTGMGRLGVAPESVTPLCELLTQCKSLEVRGVYSHFATADNEDIEYAKAQLATFLPSAEVCRSHFGAHLTRHIAASGGVLSVPGSALEMIRPGILLFGVSPIHPTKVEDGFRPSMSLLSRVTFVKRVNAGASIGYGRTWRAKGPTTIATVPLGYGDGFSRQHSNKGSALVNGRRVPIVGRVSMDQVTLDCGDTPVAVGDRVTFIGTDGPNSITVEECARTIGTAPHEVITLLNGRLTREYVS